MAIAVKSLVRRNQSVLPRYKSDDVLSKPIRLRKSLPAYQRQGTSQQSAVTRNYQQRVRADVLSDEEEQPRYVTTDDLGEQDALTTKMSRGAKMASLRPRQEQSCYQPQQERDFPWTKVISFLVVLALIIWGIVWGFLSLMAWWTDVSNTYQYGPTRTTVVNGVFGINNDSPVHPTSVIAINVKGVLVIESLPAGDVGSLKTYPTGLTLVGESAAKIPVILTVKDLDGDHKPDVLIEIPGQNVTLKLLNTGSGFKFQSR